LQAVWTTIVLSVLSMALGFAIGIVVGALRTYGGRLLDLALGFYVDSMRSIPLLVVLVWTFFAFPLVIGWSLSVMTAGVLALGAHLGSYMAETIRAGLTSVRRGQMWAALALGMSRFQAIRTIILPQALIRMLPALGSLFVFAVKDSAIASVIAVPELLRQTQVVAGNTFHPFELYTGAMLVYFLLCFPVARGVDRIYRRLAHLGSS
jgi:His/Glu/Gln/Arg/opine family amino acid ABC transporter permease subunit